MLQLFHVSLCVQKLRIKLLHIGLSSNKRAMALYTCVDKGYEK